MLSGKLKKKVADAVIELHDAAFNLTDFREFPVVLESVINRLFHIDWLLLGFVGAENKSYSIFHNPWLPFNWDEKYAEIYNFDRIRFHTLSLPVGGTYLYDKQHDDFDEQECYLLETIKKYTDTSQFLTMHTAQTDAMNSTMGFYRSDKKFGFSVEDKQILDYLSPVLVSISKTIMLYSDFDLKRAAIEKLQNAQKALTIILDEKLQPLSIPRNTREFLDCYFPNCTKQAIPEPILFNMKQILAADGCLKPNTGPWVFEHNLPNMRLLCKVYSVVTEFKRVALLISLIPHYLTEDFSILSADGLSQREIEALSYLPLGYSNKQIAMAMGIEEVTVKKHLKNIARKLDTAGRIDTLYQAIKRKEFLEIVASGPPSS